MPPVLPTQRSPSLNRDVDPVSLTGSSPGPQTVVPARQNRSHRLARQLRVLTARMRAIAWKVVKLFGEEFVKGFANKAGGITALVLSGVVVAYALGVDPADAVRRILGM
ncbi:hypothetical protein ACIRPQ_34645 [Streptomyces sp. NPDC101213]|uniref:hypothetical protein n=1 Tax=Streptomyces sp. NPDC101213 TaxID=3366130 RepID=UPI00382F518D